VRDWLRFVLVLAVYVAVALLIAVALVHAVALAEAAVSRDTDLLARVVQAEATGEPERGQRAVAWTAINRLRAGTYGKTLSQVLQAPRQYAKPADVGNSPAYREALQAASQALSRIGGDPGHGATHFYRCDMRRKPVWARRMVQTVRLGKHCFHKVP
jgi:N-acetylmuramoyl-L-alanine amidase